MSRVEGWWLVVVAALAGCADLIGGSDLHRVDCLAHCEGATGGGMGGKGGAGGSGGGGGIAGGMTGDASSDSGDARSNGGAAGRGGADGGGGAAGATGGGGNGGGGAGAGGSADLDGSAGAGGRDGGAGSGGSDGGGGSVCPIGGWPAGWICLGPGTFTMGSPPSEMGRSADESQHSVILTRPFWIQANEVTQADWQAAMGNNPASNKSCGANCPVEAVKWFDAVLYANARSMRDGYTPCYEKADGAPFDAAAAVAKQAPSWRLGLACPGYRLLTEAEWEYAARAGTKTGYFSGDPSTSTCMPLDGALDVAGWYCANSSNSTQRVRAKRANAWGIYDMHGNVYEWVWDWAGPYPAGLVTDPLGPPSGTQRYLRGGAYNVSSASCRSARRAPVTPESFYVDAGLRLARSVP